MHAAEYDILGVGLRSHHRKLIRVARQIGVPDDVVALVMVSKYDDPRPKLLAGKLDPLVNLLIGHHEIIFENLCFFQYSRHHSLSKEK